MNSYVTVDLLKGSGVLNMDTNEHNDRLRGLLEGSSRTIEDYAQRLFYSRSLTLLFDGDGSRLQGIDDLISITTLKTDDDVDRTFETTWATTDYLLLPSNADPATTNNPRSRPYYEIEVDPNGNQSSFTKGRQTVQIVGVWGYWQHLKRATETVDGELDAIETGVDVSARQDIQAGHTILIDSEQMYVKSYEDNVLTVVRGVNGTTAATHTTSTVIDIYEYPSAITEAVLITASRLWTRRLSGFANSIGLPDGSMQVFRGIDPDVRMMLDPYRLAVIA